MAINTEKPNPNTHVVIIAAILAVLSVTMTLLYLKQRTKIRLAEPAAREKSAQQGIDTVHVKRSAAITAATDYSAITASKSKTIIKNLKQKSNEKIIIRDTAYAAMCEYVSGY